MRAPFLFLSLLPALISLASQGQAATRTVTTLSDEFDTPSGEHLSLREAIRDAAPGDFVNFSPELNGGTIPLTLGEISIGKDLTVTAMSLDKGVTLDGEHRTSAFSTGATVVLKGLNIIRQGGLDGGGIRNTGQLTMEHCSISEGLGSGNGTAIHHAGTGLTLLHCSITYNRVRPREWGSMIYIASGPAKLLGCTVANNDGGWGSGIIHTDAANNLELTLCTITGNRLYSFGAAVRCLGLGSLTLRNSVLADNLSNTLAGTATPADLYPPITTIQTFGQNFLSSNHYLGSQFPPGLFTGTPAAPLDPLLSPLGLHGGRTLCRVPLSKSRLRDAGTTPPSGITTDQRGEPRTIGTATDIGAVEAGNSEFFPANGSTTVATKTLLEWSYPAADGSYLVRFGTSPGTLTTLGTTNLGRWTPPDLEMGTTYYWRIDSGSTLGPLQSFTTREAIVVDKVEDEDPVNPWHEQGISFREAILIANGRPGLDVIHFDPLLAGKVLQLENGPLEIVSELHVDGSTLPSGVTISGGSYRISERTRFDSLTLIDGYGVSTEGTIYVTHPFTARNCTIANNRAPLGGGIGIYGTPAECTLIHCTVTGNTALVSGGGIYNGGGKLTLENSIIAGNISRERCPDIFTATVALLGENLVGNNSGSESALPAGPLTGTASQALDASIAPAGSYPAGTTWHAPLLANSPAIGQAIPLPTTPAADQLGRLRPSAANADLGANQRDASLLVSIPGNGDTDVILKPTLVWNTPGDSFEVFFGTDPGNLASLGSTTNGSFALPVLDDNTVYYWRIDATSGGATTTGSIQSFSTRGDLIVTTAIDEGDAIPSSGSGISLREAIKLAKSNPGPDRIRFAPALSGERILLEEGTLELDSEVSIDASDLPGGLTIDLNLSRTVEVTEEGDASLRGIDITGYNGPGASCINIAGSLVMSDLAIYGNILTEGSVIAHPGARLIMERCSVHGNEAGDVGGLNTTGRIVRCSNSSFINNAGRNIGAIFASAPSELIHCTISGNRSGTFGALRANYTTVLDNCIVAGNHCEPSPLYRDISATHSFYVKARGQNLIGVSSVSDVFPYGPLVGTPNSPVAPGLLPAARYGSKLLSMPLDAGSLARNAGIAGPAAPSTDQRGAPRINGAAPDLGAIEMAGHEAFFHPADQATEVQPETTLAWTHEAGADLYRVLLATGDGPLEEIGTTTDGHFNAALSNGTGYRWQVVAVRGGGNHPSPVLSFSTRQVIEVTTSADENDTDPSQGSGISLREALRIAEAQAGADRIEFSPGLNQDTLLLALGELVITSDVRIDGLLGSKKLAIDAGGTSRVFRHSRWQGEAHLKSLILRRGRAMEANGGGITNSGRMALDKIDILDCQADGNGGAIYNDTTAGLSLTKCSLTSNRARLNGHCLADESRLTTANDCTVAHNSPLPNSGGPDSPHAIQAKVLHLVNCTIAANQGGKSAIRVFQGDFTHTTITGNHATSGPGGAFWEASLQLRNCIVAANHTDGTGNPELYGSTSQIYRIGAILLGSNAGMESIVPAAPLIGTASAPLDPMLFHLGYHGGDMLTAPPLPGSPAIDAAPLITGAPSFDQRGLPRSLGSGSDLGAIEAFPLALELVDSDGDGMDDRLEVIHGFQVGLADGHLDADGDGSSNAEELGNRSDPHDASDFLRVTGTTQLDPASDEYGPLLRLTWTTSPGLHYTLELSEYLDFDSEAMREVDAGTATGQTKAFDVRLRPGKDFIRIRRD